MQDLFAKFHSVCEGLRKMMRKGRNPPECRVGRQHQWILLCCFCGCTHCFHALGISSHCSADEFLQREREDLIALASHLCFLSIYFIWIQNSCGWTWGSEAPGTSLFGNVIGRVATLWFRPLLPPLSSLCLMWFLIVFFFSNPLHKGCVKWSGWQRRWGWEVSKRSLLHMLLWVFFLFLFFCCVIGNYMCAPPDPILLHPLGHQKLWCPTSNCNSQSNLGRGKKKKLKNAWAGRFLRSCFFAHRQPSGDTSTTCCTHRRSAVSCCPLLSRSSYTPTQRQTMTSNHRAPWLSVLGLAVCDSTAFIWVCLVFFRLLFSSFSPMSRWSPWDRGSDVFTLKSPSADRGDAETVHVQYRLVHLCFL